MTGKKLQRVLACLLAVLLLSQVGAFSPAVFAADDIDYTLQNGTAIIKSTMTTDEVNHALTRALVKGFDRRARKSRAHFWIVKLVSSGSTSARARARVFWASLPRIPTGVPLMGLLA